MPNYRRAFIPGGCWFFTVNLVDRRNGLLVDRIDDLNQAIRETQQRFPFEIDALVVLPDHLHGIWTLPPDDSNFAVRWRWIRIRFSKSIPHGERLSETRRARGERGIWQRRYWEHLIRDERDYQEHVDYCWFNPVKHGLVDNVEEWPHSTFHRDRNCEPAPADFEAILETRAKAVTRKSYGERES